MIAIPHLCSTHFNDYDDFCRIFNHFHTSQKQKNFPKNFHSELKKFIFFSSFLLDDENFLTLKIFVFFETWNLSIFFDLIQDLRLKKIFNCCLKSFSLRSKKFVFFCVLKTDVLDKINSIASYLRRWKIIVKWKNARKNQVGRENFLLFFLLLLIDFKMQNRNRRRICVGWVELDEKFFNF